MANITVGGTVSASLTELYNKLARGDVSVFQGPWSVDPLLGAPTAYGFENAPAV